MAKTINSGSNVVTTQTFTAWLNVTNEMVGAFANVISVDLETFPSGTAGVNGAFVANTLTVTTGLLTANAGANVVGSLSVSESVSIGSNVVANNSTIVVGNTSIFSTIDNSGFEVGNTSVKADRITIGNSTVNSVITQSGIDIDGTMVVLGATSLSNTLSSGNTTISGFVNVSSTLQVSGQTTLSNTLSTGNTTISGFANVSGTANVGGATNLRSTLVVNGAVTIANTLSTGNTTISGFANVSGTANVGGAVNLRNTLTVNGAVTIANTLSAGNTTVTGDISVVGLGASVSVGSNVSIDTSSISLGNTTVNTEISSSSISTTGNLTVNGTINRAPKITLGGVLSGNVTLSNLQSGTLTASFVNDSLELGTHTTGNYVKTITTANGVSGAVNTEGGTANLKVVPGNGIAANSTGVHVLASSGLNVNASSLSVRAGNGIAANATGVHVVVTNGLSVNASSVSVAAGAGIVSNTSGVHVRAGTDIVANSTGVHVGSGVARLASPVFTGNVTIPNLTISGMITANSAAGVDGQVLRSDGVKVYWGQPLEAGDTGFIVDVTAGSGLVKSGTASEPTISAKANNGLSANSSGLFVKANTGLFTNTSGLFVNASSVSVGTLPVSRGGTGVGSFSTGALLKGNGTGSIQVASASDIVGQIGNTFVENASFASNANNSVQAQSANVASNTVITNDISSAVTVYPVWVDGTSGNRSNKVSSTKLSFNPSTGALTATRFSGNGSSLSSVTAIATSGSLSTGNFLVGNTFNGSTNVSWSVDATSSSTASKVVARDANSSFSANVVSVNELLTSSDIDLKSNLVIIDDALEKVKALNGYTYDRQGSKRREAGVVAQEVQSVLPEVVRESDGYLSVSYGNMVALLIEAIKDQQKQIDELKEKLGE